MKVSHRIFLNHIRSKANRLQSLVSNNLCFESLNAYCSHSIRTDNLKLLPATICAVHRTNLAKVTLEIYLRSPSNVLYVERYRQCGWGLSRHRATAKECTLKSAI